MVGLYISYSPIMQRSIWYKHIVLTIKTLQTEIEIQTQQSLLCCTCYRENNCLSGVCKSDDYLTHSKAKKQFFKVVNTRSKYESVQCILLVVYERQT